MTGITDAFKYSNFSQKIMYLQNAVDADLDARHEWIDL